MKLDDKLPTPLYKQLFHDLKNKIRAGIFAEGSRLPSEQELSELYGTSRITVRSALKDLEKNNLIVRKQGKGTFVSRKKMTRNLSLATSFTEACLEMGKTPGAKVVRFDFEDANEDDIRELKLSKNSKVIVLERLRFADGEPISLEMDRFPDSFSFLLNENMNDTSLMQLLTEKYKIDYINVRRTIELVYATDYVANYLNIQVDSPLLFIESVGHQAIIDIPCQRSLQYILGDRFKLYI